MTPLVNMFLLCVFVCVHARVGRLSIIDIILQHLFWLKWLYMRTRVSVCLAFVCSQHLAIIALRYIYIFCVIFVCARAMCQRERARAWCFTHLDRPMVEFGVEVRCHAMSTWSRAPYIYIYISVVWLIFGSHRPIINIKNPNPPCIFRMFRPQCFFFRPCVNYMSLLIHKHASRTHQRRDVFLIYFALDLRVSKQSIWLLLLLVWHECVVYVWLRKHKKSRDAQKIRSCGTKNRRQHYSREGKALMQCVVCVSVFVCERLNVYYS